MRLVNVLVASAGLMLPLQASSALAQAEQDEIPSALEHPGEVAWIEDGDQGVYRHFPSGLRLYYSDLDPPGQSMCNAGCSTRWIPLLAPEDAEPVGDWAIIIRESGQHQWAFKGQAMYTRIHDSPREPAGDGAEGGTWHLLPYVPLEP